MPRTENPDARIAYREGLQAIRDATWETAALAFDRARKADPGFAAAHLRYAMIGMSHDVTAAREAFRKARGLRASLDERDQAMLDASEPLIQSDPADSAAAARKFEALSKKYPGDAEIVFWHARTTVNSCTDPKDMEPALALLKRCVELDPYYADCWQTMQHPLNALKRNDEALVALDKCIQVSAGAIDCLNDKIRIDGKLGHCSAVNDTARQWMTKEPSSARPYIFLAGTLYSSDQPEASVLAALEQADKRQRAAGNKWDVAGLAVARAVAFGDFDVAIREADATRSLVAPMPGDELGMFLYRAELRVEVGRIGEAAALADEFFAKNALLAPGSAKKGLDPTVYMHSMRLRAGKISIDEYRRARADWLAEQKLESPWGRNLAWKLAYSLPAYTREMAEEALVEAEKLAPIPPKGIDEFDPWFAAAHGFVRVLAGKPADAIPFFERTIRSCSTPGEALLRTLSFAALGVAREAAGDKVGACSAYGSVLSRWGQSKSSTTVKDVQKRAKALACDSKRGS